MIHWPGKPEFSFDASRHIGIVDAPVREVRQLPVAVPFPPIVIERRRLSLWPMLVVMTMRLAILAILALTGCSTLLDSPCDRVDTDAGLLINCSRRIDTVLFAKAMPVILDDLSIHLPGVERIAPAMTVRISSASFTAQIGGRYMGYHGDNAVELYFREDDNREARYSALAHEWAHAWEHQVQGVGYDEWYDSMIEGSHFVEQQRISAALKAVHDVDAETLYCHPL